MLCKVFGVTWDDLPLTEVITGSKKSLLDHDIRLYEVEAALSLGIPFDWRWYSIDAVTRENMIAAKLARTSINNLLEMDATRKR